jgi:hypothetical protein
MSSLKPKITCMAKKIKKLINMYFFFKINVTPYRMRCKVGQHSDTTITRHIVTREHHSTAPYNIIKTI